MDFTKQFCSPGTTFFTANSKHLPSFTQEAEPWSVPEVLRLHRLSAASHAYQRRLGTDCLAKAVTAAGNENLTKAPFVTSLTDVLAHGVFNFCLHYTTR